MWSLNISALVSRTSVVEKQSSNKSAFSRTPPNLTTFCHYFFKYFSKDVYVQLLPVLPALFLHIACIYILYSEIARSEILGQL